MAYRPTGSQQAGPFSSLTRVSLWKRPVIGADARRYDSVQYTSETPEPALRHRSILFGPVGSAIAFAWRG